GAKHHNFITMAQVPDFSLTVPFKVFKGAPTSISDDNSVEALCEWLDAQEGVETHAESSVLAFKDRVMGSYNDYIPDEADLSNLHQWAGVWSKRIADNVITCRLERRGDTLVAVVASTYPVASTLLVQMRGMSGYGDDRSDVRYADAYIYAGDDTATAVVTDDPDINIDEWGIYTLFPHSDTRYTYTNGTPDTLL
ncbi:MAG: hypothetical protein PHD21_03335, partial [Flavobacteriales bacterium]|nr:hypothetical protein [Flavobacteriales bacterium]